MERLVTDHIKIARSLARTLLLAGVAASSSVAAEGAIADHQRERLARFSLAAGEPARAISWLDSASSDEAVVLRAKAWQMTGKRDEAKEAFAQIAGQGQAHRGEAFLALAKIALGQDDHQAGAQALAQAVALATGNSKQEALYYQAELHRLAERYDLAGAVLARMETGYWAALGYLNLAAAYSSIDRDPSRALVALRVAQAMNDGDPNSRRSGDIATRILLKAGFLAYHRGDFDKALGFLNKVELDSFHAPQALYFHGLSHAANGNYRAAMQSWHRARKFPMAFPGAIGAWLGMGRGYDESGYLGQAGEAYLAASSAFESERVSLRALMTSVEQDGAYRALVTAARRDDVEWFLADSRTLTQPRIAYLLHFMESPQAQQAVNRVAELESMATMLATRGRDLDVFTDNLEHRRAESSQFAGVSIRARHSARAEELSKQFTVLQNSSAEGSPEHQRLDEIRLSLLAVKRRLLNFDSRANQAPESLNRLAKQARSERVSIDQQLNRVVSLKAQAEKVLTERALIYLESQDERLSHALDRTEQQIAHLYEHLALTGLERGAK